MSRAASEIRRMAGGILAGCVFASAALLNGGPAPSTPPAVAHAASVAKPIPGWPGNSSQYLGRYRISKSSDTSLATGGELTVFLRRVPPAKKPVLSGILSMTTKTQVNVVYLTKFMHSGTSLWTTVNLGIFAGPVLGRFVVTSLYGSTFSAQIDRSSAAPITLAFTRFSANPHP